MPLGKEVGLSPSDIVLDGDPAPSSPKRGQSPQFSSHVHCGQTTGWIKMAIGMEVGLGPGRIVIHEDPAPQFLANVYCGRTAGWMKIPLGTGGSGDAVLDGDPAPQPHKRGTAPNFWPTSIVAKQLVLDGSRCHLVQR